MTPVTWTEDSPHAPCRVLYPSRISNPSRTIYLFQHICPLFFPKLCPKRQPTFSLQKSPNSKLYPCIGGKYLKLWVKQLFGPYGLLRHPTLFTLISFLSGHLPTRCTKAKISFHAHFVRKVENLQKCNPSRMKCFLHLARDMLDQNLHYHPQTCH